MHCISMGDKDGVTGVKHFTIGWVTRQGGPCPTIGVGVFSRIRWCLWYEHRNFVVRTTLRLAELTIGTNGADPAAHPLQPVEPSGRASSSLRPGSDHTTL